MTAIYDRCKCASRLRKKLPNEEPEKMSASIKESTCEELNKFYKLHFSDIDGCEGCLLRDPKYGFTQPALLGVEEKDRLPEVPEFPTDLIPEPFSTYIKEVAYSIDCGVEYPALAMLAYWSAVVGLKQEIIAKPGFHQTCAIYGAIVGMPSTGKSPGMSPCRRFLAEIEEKHEKSYGIEKDIYDIELFDFNLKAKDRTEYAKPPEHPIKRELEIVDATSESALRLMYNNPNGIISSQDELSSWFGGFDKYKKGSAGSERQQWLSIWDSTPTKVTRGGSKKVESYIVKRPFCSVIGALLPEYIKGLKDRKAGQVDDGLSARFLFLYPKERYPMFYDDRHTNENTEKDVRKCFEWMDGQNFDKYSYNYNCDGYVKLSTDSRARKIHKEWRNGTHRKQMKADIPDYIKGHYGKLGNYAFRIALLFHTMYEARERKVLDYVSTKSIENAIRLIEGTIKRHLYKVYSYRNMGYEEKETVKLNDWLKKKKENIYYVPEINQRYKPKGKNVSDASVKEYLKNLQVQGMGIIITHKKKSWFYLFPPKER